MYRACASDQELADALLQAAMEGGAPDNVTLLIARLGG